jgi:hypothetical protein
VPHGARAWIRRESDERGLQTDGFRCFVEDFQGDHWDRTGDLVELLIWALVDHAAEEYCVWNEARQDWDRPSQDEVRAMITGS